MRICRLLSTGVVLCALLGVTEVFAAPVFCSTSDASCWEVATNLQGQDGQLSSFPISGFVTATSITNRLDWIANNSTGTNKPFIGDWTFFVFRQVFDLTAFDPTTAHLEFQWAADDSGQGILVRGTWTPKYSLNGGPLVSGTWPGGYSYDFGPVVNLSNGFVSGLNTLLFYVEGNGVTDGFALRTVRFTAEPVPEPGTGVMLLSVLGFLGALALRTKQA